MTDMWLGLTMDDIRKLEAQSAAELKLAAGDHAPAAADEPAHPALSAAGGAGTA